MSKNVAVLIHGCHLQANLDGKDWEALAFGTDSRHTKSIETLYGRVVMGLQVVMEKQADLLIFSTGASELDGFKEGEYTKKQALRRYESIAGVLDVSKDVLWNVLMDAELDLESQNTRDEAKRNLRLCAERGIDEIYIVSNPFHIMRCLSEFLNVAEEMRQEGVKVPTIYAIASSGSTEGTVIIENPHRGDRFKHQLVPLLRRMLGILSGSDPKEVERKVMTFQDAFDELLKSFKL